MRHCNSDSGLSWFKGALLLRRGKGNKRDGMEREGSKLETPSINSCLCPCWLSFCPVVTIPPNSRAHPQKNPTLAVVLWKYQVFWEIQSPVTMDEVVGLHEYLNLSPRIPLRLYTLRYWCNPLFLTPSVPAVPNCYCMKCSAPYWWAKPIWQSVKP